MIGKILDSLTMVIALVATLLVQGVLFVCGARGAEINLFGPAAAVSGSAAPCVDLFCAPPVSTAAPAAVNLFADPPALMDVYAPDWCGVCRVMPGEIGSGDHRLHVRFIKGSHNDFPADVRRQGEESGYPVCNWVSPKGKPMLASGARALDDLVDLQKCEPGQPIPRLKKQPPQASTRTVTVRRGK